MGLKIPKYIPKLCQAYLRSALMIVVDKISL